VQSLPIPTTDRGPEAQTLAATGTDGAAGRGPLAGDEKGPKNLGPNLVPYPAVLGDSERQAETVSGEQEKRKTTENSGFSVVSEAKTKVYKNYPQGE
jgi:hypothetical protein